MNSSESSRGVIYYRHVRGYQAFNQSLCKTTRAYFVNFRYRRQHWSSTEGAEVDK